MLEFFSANYVWNLSANLALCMGGAAGEVDAICRQIQEAAASGDDAGTEAFFNAWCEQADRLVRQALERRGQAWAGIDLLPDRRAHAAPQLRAQGRGLPQDAG